ncbi:MAG: plasmid replication protein RepC [Paracoccaceae bacterium]
MEYTPITPFRRAMSAADLAVLAPKAEAEDVPGVNKWEVLRELSAARTTFELSDRELTVLQVLIGFYPETILGDHPDGLVVFPSNAAICERLNGMPCSTMRRHLARLVSTGFLHRRDSPNGKRFSRRYSGTREAFGFDLTPLVTRFTEVCEAAEAVRAATERYERQRRSVSLMRRDLASLADYGAEVRSGLPVWSDYAILAEDTRKLLRRKTRLAELEVQAELLLQSLNAARALLENNTQDISTIDGQNEQHLQNSNKNLQDSEPCLENQEQKAEVDQQLPNVPLGLVLAVCTEFRTYVQEDIRHWHEFVRAADMIRPMMGISPSAWNDAIEAMGPEEAAVVLVAMLERFEDIRSPGGYLRHLTSKAAAGEFSCAPMVMALNRREAA